MTTIKAKCEKDLKADGVVLCKKGEVVEMEVSEKTYYEEEKWICPYRDDDYLRRIYRGENVPYIAYEFKKGSWLQVRFADSETAARHVGQGCLVFSDYFSILGELELTAENVEGCS